MRSTALQTFHSLISDTKPRTADIGLAEFIELTSRVELDDWQRHLCANLERLRYEQGVRMAIHAPPQHGKSIIVSQRVPAWLLLHDPEHRVKLASYNITHASRFGRIVRDVLMSPEVMALTDDPKVKVPSAAATEEWYTAGRRQLRDAQPSFKALGLQTGFVGQSADLLVIDDPYASPAEAYSELVNNSVWRFWTDTARPRLTERSNVVLMFHRYAENDLAGRVLKEGGWQLLRYAAIADGAYQHPETKETWADPLGRADGEKLSPRFSDEFYQSQQDNGFVWLSQFQGRPTAREGAFFKISKLGVVDILPHDLPVGMRKWDFAASQQKGDWTAGVRMAGPDRDGRWYILDVVRGRWSTEERDDIVQQTATLDGRDVPIHFDQDPGQAGVDQIRALVKRYAGFNVSYDRVTGAKTTRADPLASQLNAGNVVLFAGEWNGAFVEELRQFPYGTHDDQVDATAGAFNKLTGGVDLTDAEPELSNAFSWR